MYFVSEKERRASHSTCYLEFQRGKYQKKCWLSDSVNISDDNFKSLELYELFCSVVPEFSIYGLTEINQKQWNEIYEIAKDIGGKREEAIEELKPWVISCFQEESVFTVCGI